MDKKILSIAALTAIFWIPGGFSQNSNLLKNGDFENDATGWEKDIRDGAFEFKIDRTVSHNGKASAGITGKDGWARWYKKNITITPGKAYTLTAYAKGNGASFSMMITNQDIQEASVFKTTGEWQKAEINFLAGKQNTINVLLQIFADGDGSIWIDDVTLTEKDAENTQRFAGKDFIKTTRYSAEDPVLDDTLRKNAEATGYIAYQRRSPEFFYTNSIPQKDELIGKDGIKGTIPIAQRFFSSWFMIYGLKDINKLTATLQNNELIGPNGIKIKDVQIKSINIWPQRTGYKSASFHEIPELLETQTEFDLKAGASCGYWIQAKIPENIEPETYKGQIQLSSANNPIGILDIDLKILPFELRSTDKQWSLYSDTSRWQQMTDEEILNELQYIKSYGINIFILSVWQNEDMKFYFSSNGKLEVKSPLLERFQKLRRKICLNSPIVISTEKYLECWVGKLIGLNIDGSSRNLNDNLENPELKKLFINALQAIDELMKKTGGKEYSDWYYYACDEPFAGQYMQKAIWEYRLARQAGIKTVSTCYPEAPLKQLLPYLNVDITGSINRDKDAVRNKLLNSVGSKLWALGPGCYCGRNNGKNNQEGRIMPNRYLSGFGLAITGAEAGISWTYQRPVDNPFNDFDGNRSEAKDACITYPPRKKGELVTSTLQWEGIRMGIDDYRYIYTLRHWIKEATEKGHAEEAQKSETILNELLDSIPDADKFEMGDCYLKPGNFSVSTAENYRSVISKEIMRLQALLNKN